MKKLTVALNSLLLPIGLISVTDRPADHSAASRNSGSHVLPFPQNFRAPPRIRVDDSLIDAGAVSSVNWSGYAVPENNVQTVTGTWTVPAVTSTAGNGIAAYSAIWVGIDGFNDGTVEQLGTLQAAETVRQGHRSITETEYYAWVEMYPAPMVQVGGTVKPGDVITASVTWNGSGTCTLYMEDQTQGWHYGPTQVTGSNSASDASAEWVVEAPSSNTGVLPLADFGTVQLSNCSAEINGTTGPIDDAAFIYDSMDMVTGGFRSTNKAVPSAITDTTVNGVTTSSSFNVKWFHD